MKKILTILSVFLLWSNTSFANPDYYVTCKKGTWVDERGPITFKFKKQNPGLKVTKANKEDYKDHVFTRNKNILSWYPLLITSDNSGHVEKWVLNFKKKDIMLFFHEIDEQDIAKVKSGVKKFKEKQINVTEYTQIKVDIYNKYKFKVIKDKSFTIFEGCSGSVFN